jgi:hypothetical protein
VIYFGKCFGLEILQPDYLWTDKERMNVLPMTCQASPELIIYSPTWRCVRNTWITQQCPKQICYSHWANGAQNGVISIGQWGVFNNKKGAI